MTNDRLVDWLVQNGYEYDFDAVGEGFWSHKVTGERPEDREARAGEPVIPTRTGEVEVLLRDYPEKTKGLIEG